MSEGMLTRSRGGLQATLDRLLDVGVVRLCVWVLIASVHLGGVVEQPQHRATHFDAHYHYAVDEAGRRTIVDHGEVPGWNPYNCGGLPLVANPGSSVLSPDFLLRTNYGTGPGRRLAVLLFFLMGLEGAFRLGRFYKISAVGCLAVAGIFAMSGGITKVIERGWLNMLTFQLVPWVWLAFEEGMTKWRWRIFGGAIIGWMFLCGATYPAPMALMMVAVLTVAATVKQWLSPDPERPMQWWAPALSAATIGAVGVLIGAAKVLPVLAWMSDNPRSISQLGFTKAHETLRLMTDPPNPNQLGDKLYVGLSSLALAAIGLLSGSRVARFATGGGLFFFVVSMGDFGPYSPFHLIHELPVYSGLRYPYRYLTIVALFVALAGGVGLTAMMHWPTVVWERIRSVISSRRTARAGGKADSVSIATAGDSGVSSGLNGRGVGAWTAAFVGLCLGGAVLYTVVWDMSHHNGIYEGRIYKDPPPMESDQPFRQARGNRWDTGIFPAMNRGTIACIFAIHFPQSPELRPDLPAEEYPLDPTKASVERLAWSPNAITLAVDAKERTRVLVNQNYAPPWESDTGTVVNHNGLLAVDVPAGRSEVTLSYSRSAAKITHGIVLSLVGIFGALGVLLLYWRQRVADALARWRRTPIASTDPPSPFAANAPTPAADDIATESGSAEAATHDDETGADETGADETGADETGADDMDSAETGPDQTGFDEMGFGEPGSDERTSSDETGFGETGSDETGSGGPGSGDTGSDKRRPGIDDEDRS